MTDKVVERQAYLGVGQAAISLPCFVPSVSSIKTNLHPLDYVELLALVEYPLILVSAFDVANANEPEKNKLIAVVERLSSGKTAVLLDSGNYESYWLRDSAWNVDQFHSVCRSLSHDLCFALDNQLPSPDMGENVREVVDGVLRDQAVALGTVVPIVHGKPDALPTVARSVAEQLSPVILGIPERCLGFGIVERTRTLISIRSALNELGTYVPLHLLGTGNPLSIIAFSIAGADSFDGLEWCQTIVDRNTGALSHFQHWDLFRSQSEWGADEVLSFSQSALVHNLEFYRGFMEEVQMAVASDSPLEALAKFVPSDYATILREALCCDA